MAFRRPAFHYGFPHQEVRTFIPAAMVAALVDDLRSGRSWRGESLPLPDVRDTMARLRLLLARYGGIQISVFTSEDQLSLNEHLELFIYSKSDKWLYLLEGRGLEEMSHVQTKSWKIKRQSFPAAPDLVNALASAAEKLGLTRA